MEPYETYTLLSNLIFKNPLLLMDLLYRLCGIGWSDHRWSGNVFWLYNSRNMCIYQVVLSESEIIIGYNIECNDSDEITETIGFFDFLVKEKILLPEHFGLLQKLVIENV